MELDLQYSRQDRLIFYLSKVISEEDAKKVYIRLDELPDFALVAVDKAVYEDLVIDKFITEWR